MEYGDKGPSITIAIGSPKMGGHGGGMGMGGYQADSESVEAIQDAVKMMFEAGKRGDYKEAAEYLCHAVDIKTGMSPMEYDHNPGMKGGMKY